MVSLRETGTILHIIDHCERIEKKTQSIQKEDFDNDSDVQDVVCFNLLQIGELAKGLEPKFIKEHPKVPWAKIKGMRDRIAHGYGTINMERVWETAICDVGPLREYCKELLKEED